MCRIFGFRSVVQSQVHQSLVSADNALAVQSEQHPDGWGVAYYISSAPHIVKSATTAIQDNLFKKVSGVVSSETVVAHIRKATVGEGNILNTHPFQYGNWVFVHNGNINSLEKYREKILARIAPKLKRFILGDTDSELIFYLFLSHLSGFIELDRKGCSIEVLAQGIESGLAELQSIVGEFETEDKNDPSLNYLTFLITNGETMLAHQGGKELFYSTYKKSCSVKDSCPSYAFECENATKTGYVNHLVFSSEPLSGENIWIPLKPGQMLGADWSMKITSFEN